MQGANQQEDTGMEIGIYTLGDLCADPATGQTISAAQRVQEIIRAAELADEAGLDVFGVGEHHRLDYAISSPSVVLAAIAQRTKRIKLTSATTVLSTVDPVRLYEDFATLDLVSEGRAEIMAGRGAFVESYSLFGYDMDRYDELFEEHLELFLKLNREAVVSWNGQFRPALKNAEIAPRPIQPEIPFWVGVGGSPESAARAGRYGVPMALAILGGELGRFQPLVEIYHQAGLAAGHAPEQLKTGVTGHVYLANTTEQAKDEYYSYYSNYWYIVNRQRGMGLKLSREEFDTMARPETALFVGSPEQVIEKVLRQYELFGHRRFMAQLDIGGLPFKKVAEGIELLAAKVAPVLRRETRLSR